MKFEPTPFQSVAIEHAVQLLLHGDKGSRCLYASPTGTGKSVVELEVQSRVPGCWIVTPREEILDGMMDKLGAAGDAFDRCITTPVRLRNALLRGDIPSPRALIVDEGHHNNAESYQQLHMLTGLCPSAAYTATPYRGSPRSTRELLEFWGDPIWLISWQEAADEGYIKVPTFATLPLVDDDIVEVMSSGEFDVESLEGVTLDRIGDLAEQSLPWYNGKWDKPTVYSLPSTRCVEKFVKEAGSRGLPVASVVAATPKSERRSIFRLVEERVVALAHINVVSEGVDLRLRRLVDAASTMSPVKWVQQLGRVTRPTTDIAEYICTNRNLMRHAYALEGMVPTHSLAVSESLFGPSQRSHARAFGLEAIGRFKPATVKLRGGLSLCVYSLSVPVGNAYLSYVCLVHPTKDPVWAMRVDEKKEDGRTFGKWARCEAPRDVKGFSSSPPNALSEKQLAWWKRSAGGFGMDPDQEVDKKGFQALPVLCDLGVRFV